MAQRKRDSVSYTGIRAAVPARYLKQLTPNLFETSDVWRVLENTQGCVTQSKVIRLEQRNFFFFFLRKRDKTSRFSGDEYGCCAHSLTKAQ